MSEYDKLKEELFSRSDTMAKSYIPRMYQALKDEGMRAEDAKGKIELDCVPRWSKNYIRQFFPEEAKNPEMKKRAEQKAAKTAAQVTGARSEKTTAEPPKIEMLADGTIANPSSDKPKIDATTQKIFADQMRQLKELQRELTLEKGKREHFESELAAKEEQLKTTIESVNKAASQIGKPPKNPDTDDVTQYFSLDKYAQTIWQWKRDGYHKAAVRGQIGSDGSVSVVPLK